MPGASLRLQLEHLARDTAGVRQRLTQLARMAAELRIELGNPATNSTHPTSGGAPEVPVPTTAAI